MSILFEAAKQYQKMGWRVLPILPNTKKPPTKFQNLKDTDPQDCIFTALFEQYPKCTGIAKIVSPDEIVIDIDGGSWSEMPVTPTVQTPRGYHYHFKRPLSLNLDKACIDFNDGLEVKAAGMLSNIPPGEHKSGVNYTWIYGPSTAFADPPGWLIEKINNYSKDREGQKLLPDELTTILKGLSTGRNNACVRLGGHYIGKGLDWPEIESNITEWNNKNKPPMDDQELRGCLKSLHKMYDEREIREPKVSKEDWWSSLPTSEQKKYTANKRKWGLILQNVDEKKLLSYFDAFMAEQEEEEITGEKNQEDNNSGLNRDDSQTLTSLYRKYKEAGTLSNEDYSTIRKCLKKYHGQLNELISQKEVSSTVKHLINMDDKNNLEMKLNDADCARILLESRSLFVLRDTLEFYLYENGFYKRLGTRKTIQNLRSDIRSVYREYKLDKYGEGGLDPSSQFIGSVVTWLEDERYIERNVFDNTITDKICLVNGVYDIHSKSLMPHGPEYQFKAQLPVSFNPEATCPEINNFFQTLITHGIITKIDCTGLLEWFGYCLTPDNSLQKSLFMPGAPSAGKTTVSLLLGNLVGEDNISCEPLQKLEVDRFSVANLDGKLLNSVPDLPSKPIYDNSVFKALVGGDRIRGERKGIDAFTFKNTARLMFAANKLPSVPQGKDAFWRRVLSIMFQRAIPESCKDKHVIEKITTPNELSGLLNLALIGLHRLRENKKFSNDKSIEYTEKEYTKNSDPISVFTDQCLIPGEAVLRTDAYSFYSNVWCPLQKQRPEKPQTFQRYMHKVLGYDVDRIRDDITGKRPYYYLGVELRDIESLKNIIEEEKIKSINAVPDLFDLPNSLPDLKIEGKQVHDTTLPNLPNLKSSYCNRGLKERDNKPEKLVLPISENKLGRAENQGYKTDIDYNFKQGFKSGRDQKNSISPDLFKRIFDECRLEYKASVNNSNFNKFVTFAFMKFGQARLINVSREAIEDYSRHYFKLNNLIDTEVVYHRTTESAKAAISEMMGVA